MSDTTAWRRACNYGDCAEVMETTMPDASTPDGMSPAVIAEDLRALADSLPLDQETRDVLTRAAELVELVDVQAADLARLTPVEARARDFLERPEGASDVAVATARYIVTGDPDA